MAERHSDVVILLEKKKRDLLLLHQRQRRDKDKITILNGRIQARKEEINKWKLEILSFKDR